MLHQSCICFLILAFTAQTADCKVGQVFSEIFDQFDLSGVDKVPLVKCLNGCYIYASASKNFAGNPSDIFVMRNNIVKTTLKGLLITDEYGVKTVGFLNETGDYELWKRAGTNFDKSGFVIWTSSLNFVHGRNPSAPVIEASKYTSKSPASFAMKTFTLMSADPFTLKSMHVMDGEFVQIYASGYDSIISDVRDPCVALYADHDANNLVQVSLPTPLVTFVFQQFDHNLTLAMETSSQADLIAGQHTAVITPGYSGCGAGNRFRYPEGPKNFTFALKTTNPITFSLDGHLNVKDNEPITLTTSNTLENMVGDFYDVKPHQYVRYDDHVNIHWDDVNGSGSFGFKVTTYTDKPTTLSPTTRTSTIETTTNSSTHTLIFSQLAVTLLRLFF